MFKFDEVIEHFADDVKEKFLANISAERLISFQSREWGSLSQFIDQAFIWRETPEGEDYWNGYGNKRQAPFYKEIDGRWYRHDTELVTLSEHSRFAGQQRASEDCFRCIVYDAWFSDGENRYSVKDGRGNRIGSLSQAAIDNDDAEEYTFIEDYDCYAHEDHIEWAEDRHGELVAVLDSRNSTVYSESHNICFLNSDEAEYRDFYYREHANDYLHIDDDDFNDPDDKDISNYNAGYHNLSRKWIATRQTKFTVGFEVEKEDVDVGTKYHYQTLYNNTNWCKENDSSLDDTGYELVSPVYDLFDKQLDTDLEREDLQELINADYSDNCGGHINLGSSIYEVEEMFEGLSQFFPLLYAMYPHRLTKNYSEAKKKHDYYKKEKYSAVYMRGEVLEFRIFSAVKNVKQLLWRRDLIRLFTENMNKSEADVLRMLVDSRSKLYKHLRKIYSQDQLLDKVELFVNHVKQFNNKQLPKPNVEKIKKDTLDKGLADNNAA